MRSQKMLSLNLTQNNEIHFYNLGMSQAKEDVPVMYMTYLVNQLLAESMNSNPQPQKKIMCKIRIAEPYYWHCSRSRIIQKQN